MMTTDEIDREIASRTDEIGAASANLVELDDHPGLQHVRSYPPEGVTAQRWTTVQKSLDELWQDVGWATSILDSVKALRARRSKLDDVERAELTRWLRERPLEVSRERIPLSQRTITGPGEAVGYVGLDDVARDMHDKYPAVAVFLDEVDRINSLVVQRLAPLRRRLGDAGVALPAEMGELLAVSATDPLSLTPRDVEERARVISGDVDRRTTELAELADLRANWPAALAETAGRLDALRLGVGRAAEVRSRAQRKVVSGPLPLLEDVEPALRAELSSITRRFGSSSRPTGSHGGFWTAAPNLRGGSPRTRRRRPGSISVRTGTSWRAVGSPRGCYIGNRATCALSRERSRPTSTCSSRSRRASDDV
jgi:hypothetical protein